MLRPPELLEEFLRYRECATEETAEFLRWTHPKICDVLKNQVEVIGESFLKYQHVAYVVQGPRDQGVDVLLKTSSYDETESYYGVQVKSYAELDDRKSDLSKQLKAGFFDARSHYGSRLERYYIALCGDAKAHANRISAISMEFAKENRVRVVAPRHLLTFLTMTPSTISAIVDRFLKEDDEVRRRARAEVHGCREFEVYFLLAVIAWSLEHQSDKLPDDFFERDSRIRSMRDRFGSTTLDKALTRFRDTALEIYAVPGTTRVRVEEYPAIRALYYDLQVRYEESPADLFEHLYEFLKVD